MHAIMERQIYLVIVSSPDNTIQIDGYPTREAARKKLAAQFRIERACSAHAGRKEITDTLDYDFFLYQGPDGRNDWKVGIEVIKYHY